MNVAVLSGMLARDPELRELPSGEEVLKMDLVIRDEDRKTCSVPLAWINAPARAHKWSKGTEIVVQGRVVRRFFRANGATVSRTEVVVDHAVVNTQRVRVKGLLNQVATGLGQAAA